MQADGSVLGVATERAVAWAKTPEQLAAVSFVAWCRDTNQSPEWYVDDYEQVTITQPLTSGPVTSTVTVLLDNSDDHDTFLVGAGERNRWYSVVRLLSGSTPIVHILGLTATLDQLQRRFDGAIPRNQLLRCQEWLSTPEVTE